MLDPDGDDVAVVVAGTDNESGSDFSGEKCGAAYSGGGAARLLQTERTAGSGTWNGGVDFGEAMAAVRRD